METSSRKINPFSEFEEETHEMITQEENSKASQNNFEALKEHSKTLNTVQQAVDFLISDCLSKESIEKIKDETPLNQIGFNNNHFGINMYLRNLFFHGNDNKVFKDSIRSYETSASYGELGEGNLADALWRKLNNCEVNASININKIKALKEKSDKLIDSFLKSKGLVKGEISHEQFDSINKEWSQFFKDNHIHENSKRIELLSYNLSEEDVETYMKLREEDVEEDEWLEHHYKEKSILALLKEEELPIFEQMKKQYFDINNVIVKLKSRLENETEHNTR